MESALVTYLELLMNIITIGLDFIIVYLGYEIYRYNRLSKGWLFLVLAFFLDGLRDIITLYQGWINPETMDTLIVFLDATLVLTITLLIGLGLWHMHKKFEHFDIVHKQTNDKIKAFATKKKAKRSEK